VANDTSLDLWRRLTRGESLAAEEIHRRYVEGLLRLARQRLSQRLARRVDAEDIVQSAYRSFFIKARSGGFQIERSGDLWRLLAAITVKKLLGQVEFHCSDRRDLRRECAPDAPLLERMTRQPSPEDLAVAAEQLQLLMTRLAPEQREALKLRLQDYTLEEIAERTGRTERTIRRWLAGAKQLMEERLAAENHDHA
jgi:RNA polymerase sigma-70 factor (ECF subfamily)